MKVRVRLWVLVGVVVVGLGVAVPAMAADRWPPMPEGNHTAASAAQGRRFVGKLVSVDGDQLVVDYPLGQLNVKVDDTTHVIIPGIESPSIADLEIGVRIGVQGRRVRREFRARVILVIPDNAGRLQGEVVTIGVDTFVLRTADADVTIQVDEQTRFHLRGTDLSGLAGLVNDDRLTVLGLHQQDGIFLAREISRLRLRVREIRGTVQAVEADGIVVSQARGADVTFFVNAETLVLVPGLEEATLDDVNVGDTVRVRARGESDAFIAECIVVVPPDAATLSGEIVGLDGATLEVETRLEQVIAVQTDAATRFVVPGVESPSLADVREGDRVRVAGTWSDATHFTGWVVQVAREGRVGRVQGRILSLGNDGFTLGSPHGVMTITVDDDLTQYQFPGNENPGFEDLTVGQCVIAAGAIDAAGSLAARQVVACPQR